MSRTTGYVFDERCMWHDQGSISWSKWIEPGEHWENVDTKRRIHNLLNATGMISNLKQLKGRFATRDEIERFHTLSYVAAIKQQSDTTGATMAASDSELNFAKGGFEVALLGAGCVLAAVEALLIERSITNAYCLVRPPGHHAEANRGCGFCMFNNVVVAAHHARVITEQRVKRIAVIDYDVHHGNGTQDGFWNDENALLISLHQDSNYPIGTGRVSEVGGVKSPDGTSNSIINVPLPPGSGTGAYEYSFHRVVVPALRRFKPDLIFVSSGFDASFADPLGAMILGSDCYAFMTEEIMKVADELCEGRLIYAHEGGYSKDYVPFCALAVLEKLSGKECVATNAYGETERVVDPYLGEVNNWGYQECQLHQMAVVDAVAAIHNIPASVISGEVASQQDASVVKAVASLLKTMDPARQDAVLQQVKDALASSSCS